MKPIKLTLSADRQSSVFVNPDAIVWFSRKEAGSIMEVSSETTLHVLESPKTILALLDPPAPPARVLDENHEGA